MRIEYKDDPNQTIRLRRQFLWLPLRLCLKGIDGIEQLRWLEWAEVYEIRGTIDIKGSPHLSPWVPLYFKV
jgi:hypothetical protein